MSDDWRNTLPTLREETRAAQGRALELLASAVVISTLLSLAINLSSSLIANTLPTPVQIALIAIAASLGLLAIIILLPRISTTVKEFEEDIELVVPLMVSPNDISVLRVRYYDDVTELAHAAITRMPAEQRKEIAHMLLAQYGDADSAERAKLTAFLLDLTQFLMAGRLARESRSLLGPHAAYHKLRSVARQQSAVTSVEWRSLAAQVETNTFLHQRTQGIPEKVLLPDGVSLMLPEVAPTALGKVHRQRAEAPGIAYVPLLEARSRRDVALRISTMVGFSEHGLPTLGGPEKGFTARCVMRNVRDERIRSLAKAEEQAASEVVTHRRGKKPDKSERAETATAPDATATYTAAFAKLYDSSTKPHLIRIFVRFDGMFRIRLLLSDRRQRGRYAWGAALSRLLAESDIEVFLATLHENGQKTPRRTF
ncbi:MAG TPA: hypothetical protein VFW17_03195 [Ktedonobacterales bacterium]|nr:hypothetical protein [Ktedonobacterales bacterium]